MKFNEDLFYEWLLEKSAIKRDATKQKIAYCMVCLIELHIKSKGRKVKAIQLYKYANTNKAALHYAVGGVKNLWEMIRRATSDYEHRLSKKQKSIISHIFADAHQDTPAETQVSAPDVRLMNYPSALNLMIRRDFSVYRSNWAGGRVMLHCDKQKGSERTFLFVAPEGISITWNPSVQDQLAENWAIYRA
ncbi:Thoeris anti-defense Tad2 family protein [Xenorhabdus hominickii]|uniref:Thoeris anti-defense 2-like domain-containing protein n=1 Tax=Xenorhabdus hominickii TaxID=351679 RepID=A0A1V0M4N8_XENHO|nr:hypothetical protein [Xenorhabdus hominickii]ARD69846.1 hypothetical protein [Xenorhabdus hominickii]PHM51878.1 hypothetical protein Xhom_04717 [Xenorhabdus hominickii]